MRIITTTFPTAPIFIQFSDDKKISHIDNYASLTDQFKLGWDEGQSRQILYVSVEDILDTDGARELGFNIQQQLNSLAVKNVAMYYENFTGFLFRGTLQPFFEGMYLGDYNFQKYKSEPTTSLKMQLRVGIETADKVEVETAIDAANIRVSSQCLTRDMVNGTGEDMTSTTIAGIIGDMFEDVEGIEVTQYGLEEMDELGMNGHIAVNRASPHPPITVKLTYTPPNLKRSDFARHIVLIGKGLTYDSGGLSIKPTDSMVNMKCDKAGAMTVLGIMHGLSSIAPKRVMVTAYVALAENSINGNAYKPGDVITMMNKKTVHVRNTDAEGRIVLFDNICLAEKENPGFDEMYTFATLTGAALSSFGAEAAGMVGFNDDLKAIIKQNGEEEGEIFCNAEFHKYMLKGVDDDLADLSNTGTKYQGCHKAGLFLTNALSEEGKKRFLHLDIAGPAFAETPFGTNPKGGTGFGVRTFLKYLTTPC